MKKTYKAWVKDSYTKQLVVIESEYANKKDFYDDLKGNGYRVRVIATPDKFEKACDTWCENAYREARARKITSELRRKLDEKLAAEYNMTVREYRKYMKEYLK